MVNSTPRYGYPLIQANDRIRTSASRMKLADDINRVSVRSELVSEMFAQQMMANSSVAQQAQSVAQDSQSVAHDAYYLASMGMTLIHEHDPRIQALESLGGLSPGGVSDATVASLIAQHDSQTTNTLSGQYQARLWSPVAPEEYGAIGDGVTDDTAALQEWADSGGVRLRPGSVYRTTSQVLFAGDNRALIGNGAKILHQGSGGPESFALRFDGDKPLINGVDLDGTAGVSRGGIRVHGDFAQIINNRVQHFTTDQECMGIQIVGEVGGNLIANNVVHDIHASGDGVTANSDGMSRGIYYHTPNNQVRYQSLITGNTVSRITGEEGDGIHVIMYNPATSNQPFGSAHTVVQGNTITDCTRRYIKGQASHLRVTGNTTAHFDETMVVNSAPGIQLIRSNQSDVSNNVVIVGHHITGITVNSPDHIGEDNTIRNNVVHAPLGSDRIGIFVNVSTRTDVSGNVTRGGHRGLSMGRSTMSTVTGNTAYDITANSAVDQSAPVYVVSNCETVLMANNVDMSTESHSGFVNLSVGGKSVNNVSLT